MSLLDSTWKMTNGFCSLCAIKIKYSNNWKRHLKSKKHMKHEDKLKSTKNTKTTENTENLVNTKTHWIKHNPLVTEHSAK